ncbi:unnamed protein product, partial [marine sediment metagenome]
EVRNYEKHEVRNYEKHEARNSRHETISKFECPNDQNVSKKRFFDKISIFLAKPLQSSVVFFDNSRNIL